MKKYDFSYISEEHKSKFLKMCLLLFPQYKIAELKQNGDIILTPSKKLSKKVKTNFFSLISEDIIYKISILRWNSSRLAVDYMKELNFILDEESKYKNKNIAIEKVIDTLYGHFSSTKLRDIYTNYRKTLIPDVEGTQFLFNKKKSDYILFLEKGDKVSLLFDKGISYKTFLKEIKRHSLSLMFGIMFSISSAMHLLTNVSVALNDKVPLRGNLGDFPWKIIYG